MNFLFNLDLLSVGIAIAAIGILGVVIYLSKPKSATSKAFLFFSLITICWSIANYANYQVHSTLVSFWILRFVIFFAVWHAFTFYQLADFFPQEKVTLSNRYKYIIVPGVFITSLLTLTPLVFSQIAEVSSDGKILKITNGPGIIIFAAVILLLILRSIYLLFKKTREASGEEREQFQTIASGTFITFLLLIVGNFILPAFFDMPQFIPLGALFMLPFVVATAYAIIRYHFLNIKVISTEILVFVLAIVTLLEVILSEDLSTLVFRVGQFALVLAFGILLIRSIIREVAQREKIEHLAHELSVTADRLIIANAKLKEIDRQKTEFVSIASHQLRSPLTAIKGYASMMLEGSFGKLGKEAKEATNRIFESSQKLVNVIEDFLNVTRIELGKMKYEMTDFDLKELAENVVSEMKPTIERKGIEFSFNAAAGSYMINGDQGKISQVLSNLIDNSLKYTPRGSVAVSVERTGDKVVFKVKDTGVGIAPTTMPKLFEKFIRADDAGETNIHGTGLGLYVAKQIVEAHNGRLWAESEGEGKGSTFFAEFAAK